MYRLTQTCPRGSEGWELPFPDRQHFRTLSMLCEPVTPDFLTHRSRAQGSRKRRSLSQSFSAGRLLEEGREGPRLGALAMRPGGVAVHRVPLGAGSGALGG